MRLPILALLLTAPAFACGCVYTAPPCSAMTDTTVVFLGRVLVDSGEGWGTGAAHVRIEEALKNVPKDIREVDIDTASGTSCYYRLKAGERYVIFAAKPQGGTFRLSVQACSNTFPLTGNENILDALRNQAQGGPPRMVGAVRRSTGAYRQDGGVDGAIVVARSATARYEALTDAFGLYEILNMVPDRYQIEVSRSGYVPDAEFNRRWSGRLVLNKAANVIEPDKTEPGTVLITGRSCAVWDLSMWPRGTISGTVTAASTGKPLGGVTVQAFAFDRKGERESRPLETAATDEEGKYRLEPLPGGDYVVGINAEKYTDAEAYPPTVYSGEKSASLEARISVADGRETPAIDLALPAKRIAATMRVEVKTPGGAPCADALVTLESLTGIQRWYSNERTAADGSVVVPVYVGEHYFAKAAVSDGVGNRKERGFDYLGGSSFVSVEADHPTVVVVLTPKRFSDPE